MTGISFVLRASFVSRLFILTGVFAVSATVAQGQINFRKPDFDTGKRPLSVATADFNRDGLPDIVTANGQDNSVSLLLNDGHGGFSPHTDYPVGGNPAAVLAADFNNDGVPDIAVANQNTNSISILLGKGNGSLRALPAFATGAGPEALAAGDFNHDGKLDLAVLNQNDGTVSIFYGHGDGTFTHSTDYLVGPTSQGGFAGGVVAADFNHDGILDLAVATGTSNQVFLFLGKPDGSFISTTPFSIFAQLATGPIAAADFNQDGNLDLVIQELSCDRGGCAGPILIFGGHGDGTFDQGHSLNVADAGIPLTVADINGDHVPDVVTQYRVVVVDPATIFAPNTLPHSLPMAPAGLGVQSLVAADFNGDGRTDIVTANAGDNTASLLLGNGDGSFHQPLRYRAGINPQAIVAADFNRDGAQDIAVANEIVLGIQLFFGDGNGGLKGPVLIAKDVEVAQLAVADFNGDGIPDLLATGLINSVPVMRLLPGRGDGTFGTATDRTVFTDVFASLAVGDFNGDGPPDVATIGGSPGASGSFLHIYFNNGDGTFRDPVDTPLGFQALGIAVADFNHDGKMDVVVGRNNNFVIGNVAVFLGNGDGTFRNSANFTASRSVATGDFNHDGVMDFVALPDLFLGNGDGTFRQLSGVFSNSAVFNSASGFPHVADMNGDGLPDVVIAANDRLIVFLNNGDGTFQPPSMFSTGGVWELAVADFNADGLPDIAATGGSLNETLSLLLNNGAAGTSVRDFQLTLNSPRATLTAGQSASATVSVTALGAFQDQVTFSCAGLPAFASCSFSPAMVTLGKGGTATVSVTITTQAATVARVDHELRGFGAIALGLPVLGLVFAGTQRRKCKLWVMMSSLTLCALLFGGCASISNRGSGPTPPGTYNVTVSCISSGNPAITHSQMLVLEVQ